MNRILLLGLLILLPRFAFAHSVEEPPVAPYLLPGAPSFEMTISQFRQQFNAEYPATPLTEYHAISQPKPERLVTPAATQITASLYSSTALEPGSGKIKSLQVTLLSQHRHSDKLSQQLATRYMTNLIQFFSPQYNQAQSASRLDKLLTAGKGRGYLSVIEGAVRYSIVDQGEQGLTLAIEPVRLAMTPPESDDH